MPRFTPIQKDEILAKANTRLISHTFTALALTAAIEHKLKRVPAKWTVCNLSANAVVYGTADEVYLNLTATAACSVILEVV